MRPSLRVILLTFGVGAAVALVLPALRSADEAPNKKKTARKKKVKETGVAGEEAHECMLPNEALMTPFRDLQPIGFVNRNQNPADWDKLPAFWNELEEKATDPRTGQAVVRKAVRIKVPLGLSSNPPVPAENPMTVQKWKLGKKLYFDGVLCSDGTLSCSSCHDPARGYTDQSPVSTGIGGQKGGMSAPTVMNAAYSPLQFWDGRALSLEHQAQGPPGNPIEMFDGKGHAWKEVVSRLRKDADYVKDFKSVFGCLPTQDAAAKAIATYERTVLNGNSIYDRAELTMRRRVADDDTGTAKPEVTAKDYEVVLKEAFARKDAPALKALGLEDEARVRAVARAVNNGRALFFNKARCNGCHVGDNFTDYSFHNLGVGVKDGKLPPDVLGRYGAQPAGAKNPEHFGAFKTPTLRGLLSTAPYLHDGSEKTLEQVIDFYDKGGNANSFLDVKMRDFEAERAYLLGGKKEGVAFFGEDRRPIVPLNLKLTPDEKKDLVMFLRALQGDPIDATVATPPQ